MGHLQDTRMQSLMWTWSAQTHRKWLNNMTSIGTLLETCSMPASWMHLPGHHSPGKCLLWPLLGAWSELGVSGDGTCGALLACSSSCCEQVCPSCTTANSLQGA